MTQNKYQEQSATGHYAFDDYVKKFPESPESVIARAQQHDIADKAELERRGRNWKNIKAGAAVTAFAIAAGAGLMNEAGDAQKDADRSHEIQENVNELQDLDQDPTKAHIQVTPTVPTEALATSQPELPPLRQSNGE